MFVIFWHLSCQISIESVWKNVICSLNLFKTVLYLKFSQYYNNLRFYWAIINCNFIWNIDLNNDVYWDLHNNSACLKYGIKRSSVERGLTVVVFEIFLYGYSFCCYNIHTLCIDQCSNDIHWCQITILIDISPMWYYYCHPRL